MTQISEDKKFISPTRAAAKGEEEDLSSSTTQRSTPTEEEKLEREKEEIEKRIETLPEKKKPFELEKMKLEEEIKELEKILEPISEKEKEIEEKKLEAEKEEREARTATEKREKERKRWQIEEEREKIEKEKWFQLEKIEELKKKIREFELKIKEILEEEKDLERKKEEIVKKEGGVGLKKEKEVSEKILKEVLAKKEGLEKEKERISKEKGQIEMELSKILQKEKEIEEEEKAFEEEERMTKTAEELKKIESQRTKIEKERKEVEMKRWEIEDKKIESEKEIKKVNENYKKILEREKALKEKIKEICEVLGLSPGEEIKKNEEKPEIIKEEEKPNVEEVKEEEKPNVEEVKEEEKPNVEEVEKKVVIFDEEEKLEYLKREEVRTMEKDVEKLREIEAEKERERITAIKPEETQKKEEAITVPLKKEEEIQVKREMPLTIIPKPQKRASPFQRVLVRIAAILILFSFVGFFYWFFEIKQVESPPEEKITPGEETLEKAEIIIPLSLISVNTTETLEISSLEEASISLSQFLKKESATGNFTRILIKDSKENKILGLKEFFEAFKIRVPENVYQKIGEDFNLFVYSQEEGKRIGFITKIKEGEELEELLKSWEPTMETDFGNLFTIMNKQGKALFSYFKNASYRGISFRYQTFSVPHFGICYSISRAIAKGEEENSFSSPSNQYFIFTSSGKSMMKIIEQLTQK